MANNRDKKGISKGGSATHWDLLWTQSAENATVDFRKNTNKGDSNTCPSWSPHCTKDLKA
jgi:hypothetical protein